MYCTKSFLKPWLIGLNTSCPPIFAHPRMLLCMAALYRTAPFWLVNSPSIFFLPISCPLPFVIKSMPFQRLSGGKRVIESLFTGCLWIRFQPTNLKAVWELGTSACLIKPFLLTSNQCWRILKNPDLLVSKILLPKYCSQTHILNIKPHQSSSWAWKSLLHGRDLISKHLSWTVGCGNSIKL